MPPRRVSPTTPTIGMFCISGIFTALTRLPSGSSFGKKRDTNA
jgi:hypothetical protein